MIEFHKTLIGSKEINTTLLDLLESSVKFNKLKETFQSINPIEEIEEIEEVEEEIIPIDTKEIKERGILEF